MNIELDEQKKIEIIERALQDKQDLLHLLSVTPVIEQPEVALNFVEELSKRLRSEIELERQKALLIAEINKLK
jgi:hypothetical protein